MGADNSRKGTTFWTLRITEEQFDVIYAGLDMDKERFRVPIEGVKDAKYFRFMSLSKLWRMNNWYTIIDKDGNKIPFKMNLAQHKAFARQLRHPRSIILKSRQRGISTFFLINYFDDAVTIPNITAGMQSYGLEESTALLEKLTVAWESLNEGIKSEVLDIDLVKNNTKEMSFTNGSKVKVATSFRGNTLHRLHVSELGKIANKDPKKAKELKSGTLQAIKAGNPVAIESTAEGQHNAFHSWWYTAVDLVGLRSLKDFDPVFLSWVDDPDCALDVLQIPSDEDTAELENIEAEWADYADLTTFTLTQQQINWFVASKRELQDEFYQEYPHTPEAAFAAVKDGTYYAKIWRKEGHVYGAVVETKQPDGSVVKTRLLTNNRERLYDSALPVHTAWDLGSNDMMVIVFFQVFGRELRVIDEYHNTGEGLEHYTNMLLKRRKEHGYAYGQTILPHDGNVFEMGASMTRRSRLRELGIRRIRVLKRTKDVNTDIEQVRKAIPNMWIDPKTCSYILKMMGRYSKKWDDMLGTFKDKPLHDEWSNPADALRYMVMARMHSGVSAMEASGERGGKRSKLSSSGVIDGMAM